MCDIFGLITDVFFSFSSFHQKSLAGSLILAKPVFVQGVYRNSIHPASITTHNLMGTAARSKPPLSIIYTYFLELFSKHRIVLGVTDFTNI
jgi:hypothetical protein